MSPVLALAKDAVNTPDVELPTIHTAHSAKDGITVLQHSPCPVVYSERHRFHIPMLRLDKNQK